MVKIAIDFREPLMPAQIHQLDFDENSNHLREALRLLVQSFIELEVTAFIEAHPYERSDTRRTLRNGYRQRSWRTRLGEITLYIPKLRKGTYTPTFLDELRRSEADLLEVAQTATDGSVDSRDLERLAQRVGLSPVHRSQLAELEESLHDLAQRYRFHAVLIPESTTTPMARLRGTWMGQGHSNILAFAA
jgi:transposase-like protein